MFTYAERVISDAQDIVISPRNAVLSAIVYVNVVVRTKFSCKHEKKKESLDACVRSARVTTVVSLSKLERTLKTSTTSACASQDVTVVVHRISRYIPTLRCEFKQLFVNCSARSIHR